MNPAPLIVTELGTSPHKTSVTSTGGSDKSRAQSPPPNPVAQSQTPEKILCMIILQLRKIFLSF